MGFKVIKENILKANDNVAAEIKASLKENKILMINIISSPGAGKTSFLERVGPMLKKKNISTVIISGDCFTSRDAERLDALGLDAIQINTGNACHIDASLVKKAIESINLKTTELIIVENVGNLVCPAEFDIGEDCKIAFHSTAEGHDKPIKYPLLTKESDYTILNKTDLIGHVDFDISFFEKTVLEINSQISVLKISCKTGEGIIGFIDWISEKIKIKKESQE